MESCKFQWLYVEPRENPGGGSPRISPHGTWEKHRSPVRAEDSSHTPIRMVAVAKWRMDVALSEPGLHE